MQRGKNKVYEHGEVKKAYHHVAAGHSFGTGLGRFSHFLLFTTFAVY